MSKAFTQEDAASAAPGPQRPISTAEAPITRRGLRALEEALRAAQVAPAGETEPARAHREHQVKALTTRLRHVRPVDPPDGPAERAFFGAYVEVEDEDGATRTYQLVGPDEVDAAQGRVSVDSPLGRALLGRAIGESVTVERPRGATELSVTALRYAP